MFYKYLSTALVAVIVWQMFELWRVGRRMALAPDAHALSRHRSIVACVGFLTVLAVVCIELQVRMSPAPYASGPLLLGFHLAVVALMVAVFFAIVLKWRGTSHPRMHRPLAYTFFALYAVVIVTGGVMLYRLPL
jgi:hypothetical protein